MAKKAKVLTPAKLAELLRYMATVVEQEDSLEGSIGYTPSKKYPRKYRVHAAFRVGNSMGQGSVVIV